MTHDDSDSSLDGAWDYTETSVLLGFATKEPTYDAVSHIGGYPSWRENHKVPPASLAQCKCCKGYMSLLLQLNGDLPKHFPEDERRLHIFCCRKRTCSRKAGSVRALREVKRYRSERGVAQKAESKKAVRDQPSQDLGAALFDAKSPTPAPSNSNPFSSLGKPSATSANPFPSLGLVSDLASKPPQTPAEIHEPPAATFAQKLRLSDSQKAESKALPLLVPWPDESAFPPPFPRWNLDADYETISPEVIEVTSSGAGPSKSKYDADDDGPAKETEDMMLDTTFHRFARRLAQNPEQVLRYEYGGQPLLYSRTDAVASRFVIPHNMVGAVQGLPRCESCGAARVFEMQLVPGLIEVLEEDEEIDLEGGMEWGTIILGVCSKNCAVVGEVVFREEWAGVQWEERVRHKK